MEETDDPPRVTLYITVIFSSLLLEVMSERLDFCGTVGSEESLLCEIRCKEYTTGVISAIILNPTVPSNKLTLSRFPGNRLWGRDLHERSLSGGTFGRYTYGGKKVLEGSRGRTWEMM